MRDDPEIGVVECRECGVVVADGAPRVTINYAAGSMHGEDRVPLEVWRSASLADDTRRAEVVDGLLDDLDVVLDIGCGAGGFIAELQGRKVQAIGVEPDAGTQEALTQEGLEVWSHLTEIPTTMRERVRVVKLFHVLEHVRDTRGLLREVLELLPSLRLCVVEVPCSEDPLLSLYKSEPFSNFTYWSHHEYLHSLRSLEELLSSFFPEVVVQRVQRYGLANHLGWLANGAPGGQDSMPWFAGTEVDSGYRASLLNMGYSDTLWAQCATRRVG